MKYIFLANLILFLLLLARNPFSERTLIPNLEPYPDTIHYTLPARSLTMGGPFMINREGRSSGTSVTPLYSISLIPFYLINHDVRMFYFANVVMSIISLWLLFLILKRTTNNKYIVALTLFLFVTNYFNYWFPQWAMAENLILPIFLLGLWLILVGSRKKNIFLAALVTISFYAIKKACAPLTAIYALMYVVKLLSEKQESRFKFQNIIWFLVFLTVLVTPLYWYQITYLKDNPLLALLGLFGDAFRSSGVGEVENVSTSVATGTSWFSLSYVKVNLPLYFKAMIGDQARFLWDFTPIVLPWIGAFGLLGLVVALFMPRFKLISTTLILLLLGEIIFMSLFYAFDMRYIYHAIPTLLLGFSFLLVFVQKHLVQKKESKLFVGLILVIFSCYFFKNAIRLKSQIMINIKYSETPWYYISVLRLNDYFTEDKIINGQKPIVISPMPPYYIDYFSNGNYELLPLSNDQEFRRGMNEAWGELDYSDLLRLYELYFKKGRDLYISTYGLGNEVYLHNDFNKIKKYFILNEVYDGCYTQCKIYQIEDIR